MLLGIYFLTVVRPIICLLTLYNLRCLQICKILYKIIVPTTTFYWRKNSLTKNMGDSDVWDVDNVIIRLLEGKLEYMSDNWDILLTYQCFYWQLTSGLQHLTVRNVRPGKDVHVQLSEGEIRGLCMKSRDIFLSQPVLLELEAPLKVCGMFF